MEIQAKTVRNKSNADDKKPLLRSQLSGLLDLRDRLYSELGQAAALMIATDHDKFFKGNLDALDNYLAVARNSVVGAYETYQHLDSKIHDLSTQIMELTQS